MGIITGKHKKPDSDDDSLLDLDLESEVEKESEGTIPEQATIVQQQQQQQHDMTAVLKQGLKNGAADIILHDYNQEYGYDKVIQHVDHAMQTFVWPILEQNESLQREVTFLRLKVDILEARNEEEHKVIEMMVDGNQSSVEELHRGMWSHQDDLDLMHKTMMKIIEQLPFIY